MSVEEVEPIEVYPEAELEPRDCDRLLPPETAHLLGLFASVKAKPQLRPGSCVFRRFEAGEVIFRQGDAGRSAFYILTAADRVALKLVDETSPAPTEPKTTPSANVYLFSAATRKRRGFWQAVRGLLGSQKSHHVSREYIPIDAPTDLDLATGSAPLFEGSVFGEMSCLTFAPRSGTVVAAEPVWMFEFLRNVLDDLERDKGYRQKTEDQYRARVLDAKSGHLRQLDFLKDLPQAEFELVCGSAELEVREPGEVLCEQGEPSDCVYVVRRGIVQVMLDAPFLLRPTDITDWKSFAEKLVKDGSAPPQTPVVAPASAAPASPGSAAPGSAAPGSASPETPAVAKSPAKPNPLAALAKKAPEPVYPPVAMIWRKLSPELQAQLSAVSQENPGSQERAPSDDLQLAACQAIASLATEDKFLQNAGWKETIEDPRVQAETASFPKIEKWNAYQRRVAWRVMLQVIFGKLVHDYRRRPPRVLRYLSKGECFGEMGVLDNTVRSASCIALDKSGRLELIRLPAATFRELLNKSPAFRSKANQIRDERRKLFAHSMRASYVFDDVPETDQYHELQLYQGQKLLKIDLDSCTRCGDCVRACVNSHEDGRTRLYLDGPRYENRFLIPSACRQCRDPLCMVGCPVGAIQVGQGGQIEIRDWCIGCKTCADQCPYDSIQMHDSGILADAEDGWRVDITPQAFNGWMEPRFGDRSWRRCRSPFLWNYDFVQLCREVQSGLGTSTQRPGPPSVFRFRKKFRVTREDLKGAKRFDIHLVVAESLQVTAWINGAPLNLEQEKSLPKLSVSHRIWCGLEKFDRKLYKALKVSADASQFDRNNTFAIELRAVEAKPPVFSDGQVLLIPRIDFVGELASSFREAVLTRETNIPIEIEIVNQTAVVCDLCESVGGNPACVQECPHDAAIRIDGLSQIRW